MSHFCNHTTIPAGFVIRFIFIFHFSHERPFIAETQSTSQADVTQGHGYDAASGSTVAEGTSGTHYT